MPSHFDEVIRKSCQKVGSLNINPESMNYKALNDADLLKDKQVKAAQKVSKTSAMYKNTSKFTYRGKSEKI